MDSVTDRLTKVTLHMILFAMLLGMGGCTAKVYRPANSAINDPSHVILESVAESAAESLTELPTTSSVNHIKKQRSNAKNPMLNRLVSPVDILDMSLAGDGFEQEIELMGNVELSISSSVNAYVNCFYREAEGRITKVFPNRYVKRYWLYAEQIIVLPSSDQFQIVADKSGEAEQFFCVASAEDVLKKLPRVFQANVFQPLPVENIDALFDIYNRETDKNIVGRAVSFKVRL